MKILNLLIIILAIDKDSSCTNNNVCVRKIWEIESSHSSILVCIKKKSYDDSSTKSEIISTTVQRLETKTGNTNTKFDNTSICEICKINPY